MSSPNATVAPSPRRCVASSTSPRALFDTLEPRTLFAVTLSIDYSLDTGGFFTDATRRTAIEFAATRISARLGDSLAAVSASGSNTFSLVFSHPGTGQQTTLTNPTLAAGVIPIYVGGRELGSSTLGLGGSAGFSASGTQEFLDLVRARGQAGALTTPRTDVGILAGSLTFDSTTNWHFGLKDQNLSSGQTDFISVAMHEIIHAIGFAGGTDSFDNLVNNNTFTGPATTTLFGGPVPLHDDSHFAEGTQSPGEGEAAMDPTLTSGTRKLPTALDFAVLDDIGWDIVTTDEESTLPRPTAFISGNETPAPENTSLQLSGSLSSIPSPGLITTYEWDTNFNGTTFVSRATGVTLNLDLSNTDGPSTRTVALRVTSSVGTTATTTASVSIVNTAPTGQLQISTPPSGSADPVSATFISVSDAPSDLPTLTYTFDLNDDGTIDQSGASPTFLLPFADTGTDPARTLRAAILDKDGGRREFTANLNLNFPPPAPTFNLSLLTMDGVTNATASESGTPATFRVRLSAARSTDLTASWAFATPNSDFTTTSGQVTIPAGQLEATFSLTPINDEVVEGAENFAVVLTASGAQDTAADTTPASGTLTDDDQSLTLVPDPTRARRFVAVIRGTDGNDTLNLTRDRRRRNFLTLNGTQLQLYSTSVITRIVAYLHAGNDTSLLSSAAIPQFISGGEGNDTITSGSARDILIGGTGSDSLRSGSGEDLLAAGEYGLPLIGADQLLRTWTAKPKFTARIAALADNPASPFSATTLTDAEPDTLRGDASNDLFLSSPTDTLISPTRTEPRRTR